MFKSSRKKTGRQRCPVAASVARQQPWRLEERSQVMRKAWVKQNTELRDRVRHWPRNEVRLTNRREALGQIGRGET